MKRLLIAGGLALLALFLFWLGPRSAKHAPGKGSVSGSLVLKTPEQVESKEPASAAGVSLPEETSPEIPSAAVMASDRDGLALDPFTQPKKTRSVATAWRGAKVLGQSQATAALNAATRVSLLQTEEGRIFRVTEKLWVPGEDGRVMRAGGQQPCIHDLQKQDREERAEIVKEEMGDRILVQLAPGAGEGALQKLARQHGAKAEKLTSYGLYRVQLTGAPDVGSVPKLVETFAKETKLVALASPDPVGRVQENEPNDPGYSWQWGLRNSGGNYFEKGGFTLKGKTHADVRMANAWANLTWSGVNPVTVAVIDSGLRVSHEDLTHQLWSTNGTIFGTNAVGNNTDITDTLGHGTHVAGIIGAQGNNGKGIAGVVWGQGKVRLMGLKAADHTGTVSASAAAACVDFAVSRGVKILNCSFRIDGNGLSTAEFSNLRAAFTNATANGVIVVAAAGNDARNIDLQPVYPASFKDLPGPGLVVTVANAQSMAAGSDPGTEKLTVDSNWGPRSVDLAAPGRVIYSTVGSADDAYDYKSGTSQAAPLVTGILTLLMQKYPNHTPTRLVNRLLATCQDKDDFDAQMRIAGWPDAGAALALAEPLEEEIPRLAAAVADRVFVPYGRPLELNGPGSSGQWLRPNNRGTENSPRLALSAPHPIMDSGRHAFSSATGGRTVRANADVYVFGKVMALTNVEATNNAPGLEWTTPGGGGGRGWEAEASRDKGVASAVGLPDHGTSRMRAKIRGNGVGGTIRFEWRVQSEKDFDGLSFFIDGVEQARISGDTPALPADGNQGWLEVQFFVCGCEHELEWRYEKDRSGFEGADRGWVRNVRFDRAPLITQQPAPSTLYPKSLPNSYTNARVGVRGDGVAYRWRVNGTNLADGTALGLTYANTGASNLTVSPPVGGWGVTNLVFDVVVTNAYGAVTSAPAQFRVSAVNTSEGRPKLTVDPNRYASNLTKTLGSKLQLGVLPGGYDPVTVLWRLVSGTNTNNVGTGPILSLSPLQASNAGQYVATANNAIALSNAVATVAAVNVIGVQVGVRIVKEPTDLILRAGRSGRLKVGIEGDELLESFQWKKEGIEVTNANGATLTFSNATAADSGYYRVSVSGAVESDVAKVKVFTPLTLAPYMADPGVVAAVGNADLLLASYGDRVGEVPQPWRVENEKLRAGAIGDIGETELETYVQGPGTLSFRWKTSSEEAYDVLTLELNGRVMRTLSGESDWEEVTLSLPLGTHRLVWAYRKDGQDLTGQDTAWVEAVSYGQQPQALLSIFSSPEGAVPRRTAFLVPGSEALVPAAPAEYAGRKFAGWLRRNAGDPYDPGRWTSALGKIFPSVHTELIARYLDSARDEDADGVPDWYELNRFGRLDAESGSQDTDGDGFNLAQEAARGTDPRQPDVVWDGGVAERDSETVTIAQGSDKIYRFSSSPGGIVPTQEGVTVSDGYMWTPDAPLLQGPWVFAVWQLNGVSQSHGTGAMQRIFFATSQGGPVLDWVALYQSRWADGDGDGILDWWEYRQFGSLNPASATEDQDDFSLAQEALRGMDPRRVDLLWDGGVAERDSEIFSTLAPNTGDRIYRFSSSPGGIVPTQEGVASSGEYLWTPDAPLVRGEWVFAVWQLNGQSRAYASTGAQSRVMFSTTEAVVLDWVALYQSRWADGDGDGIPDWWEYRQFGSTNPSSPAEDNDGFSLAQEAARGMDPRQLDVVWDGGVAERDSDVITIAASAPAPQQSQGFAQLSLQSSPPGIVAETMEVLAGEVLTENAPATSGGLVFAYWSVDGDPATEASAYQEGTRLTLTVQSSSVAVANYVPVAADADGDGVPDWWAYRHFGQSTGLPDADSDGDGISNRREFLFGLNPNAADRSTASMEIATNNSTRYLQLKFRRPLAKCSDQKLAHEVQVADNLNFTNASVLNPVVNGAEETNCLVPGRKLLDTDGAEVSTTNNAVAEEVTFRDTHAIGTATRRFMRVKAVVGP